MKRSNLKRPITSVSTSTLKWIAQKETLKGVGTTVRGVVTAIEKQDDRFLLHYKERKQEGTASARFVILATGIMDVQPSIQGSIQSSIRNQDRLRASGQRPSKSAPTQPIPDHEHPHLLGASFAVGRISARSQPANIGVHNNQLWCTPG